MKELAYYKIAFENYLKEKIQISNPENLYNPIAYIMNLGGKRVRPLLLLMTNDFLGDKMDEAFAAALSVEVFHNFSLVHDDIMDNAPLRRGKQTVHEKWDVNTAILSGDVMMIKAYQILEIYDKDRFKLLSEILSETAIKVCEGQQLDMDFEKSNNVKVSDYIKMITFKTAELLGASLKIGAVVARASQQNIHYMYSFGKNIGIAFQLKDDYLDCFGKETVGKKIGNDILTNKKTFLYLKSLELASKEDKMTLMSLYQEYDINNLPKIDKVLDIYTKYNVATLVELEIKRFTNLAMSDLDHTSLTDSQKSVFKEFSKMLMDRTF